MAKIYSPNKEYAGVSATIGFIQGKGETENPCLISWFKEHGYEVEEDKVKKIKGGVSNGLHV